MCKTCGCKDAETLEGEDCGCKHENEAESFEATSDELDCPSCKATPKERMGEPLCSTCNSCFECCETLCEDESFEAEYNLIGRRKPRKLSLKVSDLKEALENANDDADVFVGDITPVWEEMIGEPIVSAPRGVWTNGEEVYIVGATDWILTEQIDELTWNRVNRAKGAESFEAEDDYVIVDRGNYRVRVHKKNLDRFNRSRMSNLHSDKNKEGLMYDEETSRWIPLEAESFEAHDPSHIYPSEELTPSHSHSSETFKSSNNNTNTMAAESKFDKLSDKIAKQYRKKGMSAKEAKEIGNKTAYTIGRKKYGKAGMAKKARAGMRAESFEAQGNPDKRTTTQYAKFYVGFEDDEGELRGGGKFKKYNDAVSQAEIVSKREGNSRIVTTRGFALWTDDGKGMWQEGYDKTVAKEFYSAEGYSIGSGFRLGFGLGLGMLALSTVTTIVALAASTIDERQVE